MATEEIFIAAAITNFALIGLFAYLHHKTTSEFWKGVWLFGAFGVANYALVVINYAIENGGIPVLSGMTMAILNIFTWLLVLIFAYLGLVILLNIFDYLWRMITNKSPKKNPDKPTRPEYGGG